MTKTLHRIASLSKLKNNGRMLTKHAGKRVALFHGPKGIYACNNRCPHEGYPLSQGTVTDGNDVLRDPMDKEEHDRMVRLVARIELTGGDPLGAAREAVQIGHDRMEFGMTYAFAAASDWLRLGEERARYEAERLVARLELVAHIGFDTMREPPFPFAGDTAPYSAKAWLRQSKWKMRMGRWRFSAAACRTVSI